MHQYGNTLREEKSWIRIVQKVDSEIDKHASAYKMYGVTSEWLRVIVHDIWSPLIINDFYCFIYYASHHEYEYMCYVVQNE